MSVSPWSASRSVERFSEFPQELDELLRFRFHVRKQLHRLTANDHHHIHGLVSRELDQPILVGQEGRFRLGERAMEHCLEERHRGKGGATSVRTSIDTSVLDLVYVIQR